MKTLRHDWNQFWFSSISSVPLGLFRIAFGLLVFCGGLMLFSDRTIWFSQRGLFPLGAMRLYNDSWFAPRLNLLQFVQDERLLDLFFFVFLLGALCLALGFWTRVAAVVVFLGLNALHARDGAIINSGDALMRAMAFYLLFAPAGTACSLDRLRRLVRSPSLRSPSSLSAAAEMPPSITAWPVRIMQGQIVLIYLCTTFSKASGTRWQDGTALYYALHLTQMQRFPVPWMDGHHLWLVNLLTHATLAIEFALATLLWVPRLRLYVLAAGVLLHLGIEYSLNIPLFSFLMISSYLLFLTPEDLAAFTGWGRLHLPGARLQLTWAPRSATSLSLPRLVRFFDAFRLVIVTDLQPPATPSDRNGGQRKEAVGSAQAARSSSPCRSRGRNSSVSSSSVSSSGIRAFGIRPTVRNLGGGSLEALDTQNRSWTGLQAMRVLVWRLPALWVVAPFLFMPGSKHIWRAFASSFGISFADLPRRDLPVVAET